MVVGFLKNVETEFDGQKKKYKAGTIAFPFLPRLEITISQNKKENMTQSDPTFHINMNKAKGYMGPKSRIGALWLKKIDKQEDEINDLKEKNSKLQNTINFFENLFDRLVKFIKNKMFGKEKERENYWNFSKDLYTS